MTIAKTYYLYPVHYGVETRFRVVEMNNNIVTREWIFDYSQDGNESRGRYGEDESV